jgi:uncharacterized protein YndB with AHSA1/START domain
MHHHPIILERVFDAPVEKVWNALTHKKEMKKWYFDIAEFKPVPGFKFQFTGGTPEHQYLHLCEVTETIPEKLIAYTWQYEGNTGVSHVSFEMHEHEHKTILKLTHSGLDTFPSDNPDFGIGNYVNGWNHILDISLKEYLESK